jgi:hypothetical protein
MRKRVSIFLLAALPAFSQLVSVGVKAGVPAIDAYTPQPVGDGGANFSEDRYIVGPTAEIHLPLHFSFEADALYRRSSFYIVGGHGYNGNATINEWQIPFLAKYEAPFRIFRPFADAGVVFRHLSTNDGGVTALDPQHPNSAGIAAGGGLALKFGRIRISPEMRFTHWGQTVFSNAAVVSNNNQADFLVGFTF